MTSPFGFARPSLPATSRQQIVHVVSGGPDVGKFCVMLFGHNCGSRATIRSAAGVVAEDTPASSETMAQAPRLTVSGRLAFIPHALHCERPQQPHDSWSDQRAHA